MHMLHVEVEQPSSGNAVLPLSHPAVHNTMHSAKATPPHEPATTSSSLEQTMTLGCDNHNNIIARIIADFSDIETDSTHSNSSSRFNDLSSSLQSHPTQQQGVPERKTTYDELIFTCNGSTSSSSTAAISTTGVADGSSVSPLNKGGGSTRVSLISHQGRRHHRIVTKSYRNGVTTVDLQTAATTTTSSGAASTSSTPDKYEFSEDNEKCEKISTLRKRRLADKKYEFSEDNSENIIPFTKTRTATKLATFFGSSNSVGVRSLHRNSPMSAQLHQSPVHYFHNSPVVSPSSSPRPSSSSGGCAALSSFQQGFRSPTNCGGSPVQAGGGIMRSPSRPAQVSNTSLSSFCHKSPPTLSLATQQMLSFKPLGTLSPLQISMTKRNHLESGGMSPNNGNVPFLSPRREEHHRVLEVPLSGGNFPEKPMCTKKFKRRYVEEDDAASVITSEEGE